MVTSASEDSPEKRSAQAGETLWVAASDPPADVPPGMATVRLRSSNPRQIDRDLDSGEVSRLVVDCTRPLIDPVAFVARLRRRDSRIGIQLLVKRLNHADLVARLARENITDVQWVVVDADLSGG